MTEEQKSRLAALDGVLSLFRGTDPPAPADTIAMAEWVLSGSTVAAMALDDQVHVRYAERREVEP